MYLVRQLNLSPKKLELFEGVRANIIFLRKQNKSFSNISKTLNLNLCIVQLCFIKGNTDAKLYIRILRYNLQASSNILCLKDTDPKHTAGVTQE